MEKNNIAIITLLLIIIVLLVGIIAYMPNFTKTNETKTTNDDAQVNETATESPAPDSISVELPEFDTKYTKTVGEYTVEAEKWQGGSVGGFSVGLYKNGQLVNHDSYMSRAYFYMDGEWKWSDWGNGEDSGTYHKYPVSNNVEIKEIEVKF